MPNDLPLHDLALLHDLVRGRHPNAGAHARLEVSEITEPNILKWPLQKDLPSPTLPCLANSMALSSGWMVSLNLYT